MGQANGGQARERKRAGNDYANASSSDEDETNLPAQTKLLLQKTKQTKQNSKAPSTVTNYMGKLRELDAFFQEHFRKEPLLTVRREQ